MRREHGLAPGCWPDIPSAPDAVRRFALEATARIALAEGESRVATAAVLRLATHEIPASAYRRMLMRGVALILGIHRKEPTDPSSPEYVSRPAPDKRCEI
jgi:hypothetical protein